jgi:peptide deformylase
MIRDIINWPHPTLLITCKPWDFETMTAAKAAELAADLTETMHQNHGIGLAANQIGNPVRAFAMHCKELSRDIVMFNPSIELRSAEVVEDMEGCLSFPNIFLKIPRHASVMVFYQDELGEHQSIRLQGIDARCAAHELEHLDGGVFKDHVSRLKFDFERRKSRNK